MLYDYIDIESVVQDFLNENSDNQQNLNPDRLKTHAHDIIFELAKNSLGAQVQKIKLLEVDGYKAQLPDDFSKLVEVAYKTNEYQENNRRRIINDIYGVYIPKDAECELKCPKHCPEDCLECQESFIEMNITPRRDYKEYMKYAIDRGAYGMGKSKYHQEFQLMTANTSPYSFKQYHIPICPNLWVENEKVTYKINYPNIVVNFQEGLLLLAYFGLRLNENDEPIILGTPKVYETINYYLDEKLMWNEWRRTRSETAYKMHLAVKQLRLDAQRLAMKELTPFSVKEFWAEAKKHLQTRAGRPMNYYPFTR